MKHKRRVTLIVLLAIIICVCFLIRTTPISEKIDAVVHHPNKEVVEIIPSEDLSNNEEESEASEEVEETPIKVTPVVTPVKEVPVVKTSCYVGGCSSQVCSSNPDVMTTCEYKEEYACYQKATCELQLDGECGWTETAELNSCLSTSNAQTF